jgi:hypothetical protein
MFRSIYNIGIKPLFADALSGKVMLPKGEERRRAKLYPHSLARLAIANAEYGDMVTIPDRRFKAFTYTPYWAKTVQSTAEFLHDSDTDALSLDNLLLESEENHLRFSLFVLGQTDRDVSLVINEGECPPDFFELKTGDAYMEAVQVAVTGIAQQFFNAHGGRRQAR